MDLGRGQAGRPGTGRAARAVARAGAPAGAVRRGQAGATGQCRAGGAAGRGVRRGVQPRGGPAGGGTGRAAAAASAGAAGGTSPGSQVAKICAEPSSGAVLTTGSHRKPGRAAGRRDPGGPGRLPLGCGQAGRDHDQDRGADPWWADPWWAALGRGPGRVLHGGRLRGGPPEPRRLEQALRLGVGRPVLRGPGPGPVPGRDPGRRLGGLALVHDRPGRAALRPAAGQRALLLRERAGRPRLHPHRAAQRARLTSTTPAR